MLRNICRLYHSVHPISNFNKLSNLTRSINHANQCFPRCFSSQPSHIVQMRGLDMDTKEKDVIEFFKPLGITPTAVHLKFDGSGRVSGVTEVEFATHADAVIAMRKKNAFIGNRFVRLSIKSSELDLDQFKKAVLTKPEQKQEFQLSATPDGSYYTGHYLTMKNVPRRTTDQAIYEFFWPTGVSPVSVKALYNESGIRTGEFEVQFLSKKDSIRALAKNNCYLGTKYVELCVPKS